MQRKTWLFLRDAASFGQRAIDVLEGVGPDDFVSNEILYRAVERYLEIVGECISAAVQREPDLRDEITSAADIRRFRNLLAHGYFDVQPSQVYRIVRENLPLLIEELKAMKEPGA